jgi:alkylation response protein AidB-like acyl-CoA dehydrogenase
MASFYDDNEDLRWYVDKGLDWEPLVRLTEYDWKAEGGFKSAAEAVDVYRDMLGLVGKFVAEEVAPHWKALDEAHPKVVDGEVVHAPIIDELFAKIKDLGLHGLCLPRELGGMNAPALLLQINNELFARADVSVCAHNGFHGGVAMAALMYSALEGTTTFQADPPAITSTRFRECIDEIVAGDGWGSMDITEPGAGSDMARLRCKGEIDADGNWFVTGPKIFITSGHGRWHFVIARTEAAAADADAFAGLAGLSMFLVSAWSMVDGKRVRHVTVDKVEDKLGHNSSATCALSFERAPAHLIGARGDGFKFMLMLMNNARVGVGFESLGLCEAAYRVAKDYAAQRPSMGKTIDRHEMIADQLDEMRTDIQAIRALAMTAGWHEEIAQKIEVGLRYLPPADATQRDALEREKKRHKTRARRLTPLLKYLAAEKAVEIARRTLQILGGSGYIKEYPAEKLLRDAVVMPIYEGTSQIQSLMAMKDTLMGAVNNPARFLRRTARARWTSVSSTDADERRVAKLVLQQQAAIQFLLSRLAATKIKELRHKSPGDWSKVLQDWDPKRDFALAMLHAEKLTKVLIDVAVAETLLDQVKAHPERRDLLQRWLDRAEPRARHQVDAITTTGARILAALHGPAVAAEAGTPDQVAAK